MNYQKDKQVLESIRSLFNKDIDKLLEIVKLQEETIAQPRLQSLFSNIIDSAMSHLQKVSEHMARINSDNEYLLYLIQETLDDSNSMHSVQ